MQLLGGGARYFSIKIGLKFIEQFKIANDFSTGKINENQWK